MDATLSTLTPELRETIVRLVEEKVARILRDRLPIREGIIIDVANKTVAFDPTSQDNVDTNDYLHPYIFENNINGCSILSVFERKDNEEEYKVDGNPLVYALKGKNNWRFENPRTDIYTLLRRFVSVTTHLQRHFDTLILTPSSNDLNNRVFSYLKRLMDFDASYNTLFRKLTADEVYEHYFDEKRFEGLIADETESEKRFARLSIEKAFRRMEKDNGGLFTYRFIRPLAFRDAITKSMDIAYSGIDLEECASAIDGKDVLVFDDTVASGSTLSESGATLRNLFNPNSITFLTLFSPRSKKVLRIRKHYYNEKLFRNQ